MSGNKQIESKKQQMRKGILSYAVLFSIAKGKVYSLKLLDNLKKADMLVVEGTLYPLLNRLKREGLLEYEWQESNNGPPRKYYYITKLGKETLTELSKSWQELQKTIKNISKQ